MPDRPESPPKRVLSEPVGRDVDKRGPWPQMEKADREVVYEIQSAQKNNLQIRCRTPQEAKACPHPRRRLTGIIPEPFRPARLCGQTSFLPSAHLRTCPARRELVRTELAEPACDEIRRSEPRRRVLCGESSPICVIRSQSPAGKITSRFAGSRKAGGARLDMNAGAGIQEAGFRTHPEKTNSENSSPQWGGTS